MLSAGSESSGGLAKSFTHSNAQVLGGGGSRLAVIDAWRRRQTSRSGRKGQALAPGARESGQAAVELALVLPILLLLLVTAVDLGRAYYYYTGLANSVRVGAAWATSYAAGYHDPSPTARQNEIKRVISQNSHLTPPLTTSQINVSGATVSTGDQADITATYTFQFITPLARSLLGGDLQLRYQIRITYT